MGGPETYSEDEDGKPVLSPDRRTLALLSTG
jgi:hypothetical protein